MTVRDVIAKLQTLPPDLAAVPCAVREQHADKPATPTGLVALLLEDGGADGLHTFGETRAVLLLPVGQAALAGRAEQASKDGRSSRSGDWSDLFIDGRVPVAAR